MKIKLIEFLGLQLISAFETFENAKEICSAVDSHTQLVSINEWET